MNLVNERYRLLRKVLRKRSNSHYEKTLSADGADLADF
jgi:hypothetical protein